MGAAPLPSEPSGPRRMVRGSLESIPNRSPAGGRVLSVSPSDAELESGAACTVNESNDVFLTPRVIDQRAVDELSGTLRSLIAEAIEVRDQLGGLVQPIGTDKQSTGAAAQLQERLRLGARMLKALQMQIERVEVALEELADRRKHADERWQEVDARITAFIAELDRKVAAHEQAEVEAAKMMHRAGEVLADLKQRATEADELGSRCNEMSQSFAASIDAAESRLSNAAANASQLDESLQKKLSQAEAAAARINERAGLIGTAAKQLDRSAEISAQVEQMLARLEPWRVLLLDSEKDASGSPKPVAVMIESLRDGVGRDMAELSRTMRELADRVEACQPAKKAPAMSNDSPDDAGIITTRKPRQRA